MDSENVQGTVILSVLKAEVYDVKGEHKLIEAGTLKIIFFSPLNCFVLQIDAFKYYLSKEIPVLVSARDNKALRTYVIPNLQGHFIIRIIEVSCANDIVRIDQFLEIHTTFAQAVSDEQSQQKIDEAKNQKPEERKEQKEHGKKPVGVQTKADIASDILYKGSEFVKASLLKGAELLSKGIALGGTYIQNNIISNAEVEKSVDESTINKLLIVHKITDASITFTKTQVHGLITIGKMIGNGVDKQLFQGEIGKKALKELEGTTKIGKSTLYAAATIYEGITLAVTTVGNEIGNAATKIITQKYGENFGRVAQESIQIVENITDILKVPQREGINAIREATSKNEA